MRVGYLTRGRQAKLSSAKFHTRAMSVNINNVVNVISCVALFYEIRGRAEIRFFTRRNFEHFEWNLEQNFVEERT